MFFKIPGFPIYEITKEGQVKNVRTGKLLIAYGKSNSETVALYQPSGGRTNRTIKSLLKLTFPDDYVPKVEDEIFHVPNIYYIETDSVLWTPIQKQLRKEFIYNLETGEFRRLSDRYMGFKDVQGYLCTRFNKKDYKVHRLIMLYMLGEIPEGGQVDHINHNRADNRWENLRLVSKYTNGRNLPKYITNTSGVTGVSWHKKQKKWIARVMLKGKAIQIGSFTTKEEAIVAREKVIKEYNFHPNHGK